MAHDKNTFVPDPDTRTRCEASGMTRYLCQATDICDCFEPRVVPDPQPTPAQDDSLRPCWECGHFRRDDYFNPSTNTQPNRRSTTAMITATIAPTPLSTDDASLAADLLDFQADYISARVEFGIPEVAARLRRVAAVIRASGDDE